MEKPERVTRGYQQEMLDESLHSNIIIALDTGAGKTHIALLRMKLEAEREAKKVSWFLAPTVTLCEQQKSVIEASLPVSVGYISGAMEPTQWKNSILWQKMLQTNRIMVSTPQVLLDALRHGYVIMGRDINLVVFDEAHHATKHNPYNDIMREFYFCLPKRTLGLAETCLVRPMIMGLTASPIYGGDAALAFRMIESNLDSTIRAPIIHRAELANFVHRPVFSHLTYPDHNSGFSTNLATLEAVAKTLDIEEDPLVISLRQRLKTVERGSSEWQRLDQKLSKTLNRRDTFVHKGIRDFCQSAHYLLESLGTWSTDWFVYTVTEEVKKAANPYNNMISSWKGTEKNYLLKIIDKVHPTAVSFFEDDILDELSPKVTALVECLLHQKTEAESHDEAYSGIIFVERRYAVLALVELLIHHPLTKDVFRVGCLLGQSDSSRRHSLLDVTRYKETQKDTLRDFRNGDKNLLVCTAVAEEGIDIQACGSVIRWDPPPNMASWAQSRGRARRRRSTYTLMFSESGNGRDVVLKWEQLERAMVQLYNDPARGPLVKDDFDDDKDEDVRMEFRLESGALLSLYSAIPHLAHFCSVIPSTAHVDNRPLYDIYPPDMPEGWHEQNAINGTVQEPTGPPYSSTVTLPKCLPIPDRVFSVPQVYLSKISAHRHAAFKAYRALYEYKLLNENLLPITSVIEPGLEEEVKALLQDVEKRSSTANVTLQMNPWLPDKDAKDIWWCSTLTIEGLHNFHFYTRREPVEWSDDEALILHHPVKGPIRVYLTDSQQVSEEREPIEEAREYTRLMFYSFNGSRLNWDQLDFAYLLLPTESDSTWQERYENAMNCEEHVRMTPEDEISVHADVFGSMFCYPDDITVVRKGLTYGKSYGFVRWRMEDEPLTAEEEEELRRFYGDRDGDLDIIYPLIVVRTLPGRTNFLIPTQPKEESEEIPAVKYHILIAEQCRIFLLSPNELDCAFLMPSVLRAVAMSTVVGSFSKTIFADSPLSEIPILAIMPALTAPVAGERDNYQRLETLGDTVLKFIASLQILAEFPLWHEGYLTRKKDHTVSNGRLAKENLAKGLYRWIIRDRLISKKWKPVYESTVLVEKIPPMSKQLEGEGVTKDKRGGKGKDKDKKGRKVIKTQRLSTKILADVVEALIGAAYVYGGLDLGYECINLFNKFGTKLAPLDRRIDQILNRVNTIENVPSQLTNVETMIGYTFERKLLLIEALTHASYENDLHTPSYERMEFLGDSVLDMVVTDYLYHAPGKKYSPGHIHLRRSALVNAHFLAYICLRTSTQIKTLMPRLTKRSGANADGEESESRGIVELVTENQEKFLWQCLLHSSPRVLDDQTGTYDRFLKQRAEIENYLHHSDIFPWASLIRLQAPKFFSDIIESVLGAVFLDSGGDLSQKGAVQRVLRHLGLLDVLERVVSDNVDVLHPVSLVSQWVTKRGKNVEYKFKKEKGTISCVVLLDGEEVTVRRSQVPVLSAIALASVGGLTVVDERDGNGTSEEDLVVLKVVDQNRGKMSEVEVKFAAAEAAIRAFRLRDADVNYEIMKKKSRPKKKGKDKVDDQIAL